MKICFNRAENKKMSVQKFWVNVFSVIMQTTKNTEIVSS